MIDDDTDDIDGRDAAEISEGTNRVNADKTYDVRKVSDVVSADGLATEHTVFIYPIGSGVAIAKFKFEYEWSSDGASFTVVGKQYLSRPSGLANCYFSLRVESNGNWIPASEENARQDDTWHSFPFVHTVRSNASEELISVRVLYWQGNNRMDMNNYFIASYSRQSPSITSPVRNEDVLPNLEVSGTATSEAWVAVYEGHTARQLSDWVESGSAWRTSLREPLTPGIKVLTARQQHRGVLSGWADNISVTVLPKPSISSPISGSNIEHRRPEISGSGVPTAEVQLHVSHSADEIPHPVCIVDSQRHWRTTPHNNLPLGAFVFTARQTSAGMHSDWADNVSVVIELPVPVITGPVAHSVQDRTFTVTGNNGRSGAIVQVFRDLTDDPKLGETNTLTGANWSCSVTAPVGNISLVALQLVGGTPSNRGAPRAFRIRPPALTDVTVTTPTDTSVKFEGSGYTGSTVQITVVSGPDAPAPGPVPVNGGSWNTTATNWPFGSYSVKAVQRFPDGDNGWIDSQPYTFPVNLRLPDPTDITYTPVYRPVFSGKGFNGATVKILNPDDSPAAPERTVSGGVWSSPASAEWGPTFERQVKIRQFKDGQESPTWQEIEVTIPPLAPVMNVPVENGLSPNLSGTCWPEAVLTLIFSDSATEHPVENNNGTWSFRRTEPFAPGVTHTATLIQTAAQQPSPPAQRTFTVATPMRKPVITYPAPSAEVGRVLTVRGRDGMAEASMQVRDAQFQTELGDPKVLTADGEWSVELPVLEFRPYTIDAQQTLRGEPSERSETLRFEVVVLPPEFDVPQPGGNLPRSMTLSGTGMQGGRVDIWLQGASEPLIEDVFVGADGWSADVTLPVGETTIVARQRFEGRPSRDTAPLTFNVVPAAPFIETPATDEPIGRRVVVSGFGVPGDTVTVKLGDATHAVLGSSPVLEDRTWSVTVEFDQPGGLYGLMAVASSEGFDSADSPARSVVLGTYQPSIDVPVAGGWVDNPVRFEGEGRPGVGQVVSWFNPDQVWASDLNVEAGGWQGGASQSLAAGGHWCRFRQTITDTADGATASDWVESGRFEVQPPSSPTQAPNSR